MAILDQIFRRDFRIGPAGVNEITGKANVRSALRNRFSVFPASVPFRPIYGSALKRFHNEPMTRELENQIVKEVREQIQRDRRVKNVRKITINSSQDGTLKVDVEVILLGEIENLNFDVVI